MKNNIIQMNEIQFILYQLPEEDGKVQRITFQNKKSESWNVL